MKTTLAASAITDLEDIRDYYHEQGAPNIGKRFLTDIIAHIQTLSTHPDIGRIVPEFAKDYIRELIHPPFRVIYLREDDAIKVIRIWRSELLLRLDDN